MTIELINKDTVIDALVNRCDTLYKITREQELKIIEKNRFIQELIQLVGELNNEKIFKSNVNKQE